MIDDFAETVDRYLMSLHWRANGSPELAGYWRGRADEYAAQSAVDRRLAYRTARSRAAAEEPETVGSNRVIVRFGVSEEFVDELLREPGAVARNIVRVTKRQRAAMPGTVHVSVVATAKVASGSDYDVLQLEIPCGELYGIDGPDRAVRNRADELVRLIEANLDDSPFLVCAGLYEHEEALRS
jgi:hypothetical protein